MKNYQDFERKYLEPDEFQLDQDSRLGLVHIRRMQNEKEYREAIEARLYRLDGWEKLWSDLGLD